MSLVDFMATPYNEVKFNGQTAMHNYLGYEPTMQSKSDKFLHYNTPKPAYFISEGNDYQLPNNLINNQPAINPRYDIASYKLPKTQFTAEEIRKYKEALNPNGAKQVEFKGHELYGYSESLS